MSRYLRPEWIILVLGLTVAVGAIGYRLLLAPTRLSIAIPAGDAQSLALMEALSRVLDQQKTHLSLKILKTEGPMQAAAALEGKTADLAVVRPDIASPENGMTVAILREEGLFILAPAAAGIEDLTDLAKKRIGLIARDPGDERLLLTALAAADLAPPAATVTPVAAADVAAALREKRIDAVAAVGAPTDPSLAAGVKGLIKATGGKIVLVAVSDAEAIAARFPALAAIDVPAGVLAGRPRQPEEETKALAVTHRLVARADLAPATVAEFAQFLFEWRPRLARTAPSANAVRAPETSMSATLPNHPGAIQYLERERQTFFELYGDYIYLTLFFGGGLFSAVAALFQRITRRRRELVDEVLDRLLCILTEARATTRPEDLDGLSSEIDGLVTHAVRYARHRTTGTRTMSALILALDAAREAIAERRRMLGGGERTAGGRSAGRSLLTA
jgi:TRAP transporter TAXI family solute receptor